MSNGKFSRKITDFREKKAFKNWFFCRFFDEFIKILLNFCNFEHPKMDILLSLNCPFIKNIDI